MVEQGGAVLSKHSAFIARRQGVFQSTLSTFFICLLKDTATVAWVPASLLTSTQDNVLGSLKSLLLDKRKKWGDPLIQLNGTSQPQRLACSFFSTFDTEPSRSLAFPRSLSEISLLKITVWCTYNILAVCDVLVIIIRQLSKPYIMYRFFPLRKRMIKMFWVNAMFYVD